MADGDSVQATRKWHGKEGKERNRGAPTFPYILFLPLSCPVFPLQAIVYIRNVVTLPPHTCIPSGLVMGHELGTGHGGIAS